MRELILSELQSPVRVDGEVFDPVPDYQWSQEQICPTFGLTADPIDLAKPIRGNVRSADHQFKCQITRLQVSSQNMSCQGFRALLALPLISRRQHG